jgi:molybdenum cofactor cytidylyltransferase
MPKVAALILAAGESSRFGRPKQLIEFRGKTLIRRAVDAGIEAKCAPIVVVAGSAREKIEEELRSSEAEVVENKKWKQGIGTSIRAGVAHLMSRENPDGIVLLTCDQPFVDAAVVHGLIQLHQQSGKPIVASSYANTLGVPALFARTYFDHLLALKDDTGAKSIIARNPRDVALFSFPEGNIDIDSPEDWENLERSANA